MIVGTVRPEETEVNDTQAGYHSFHSEFEQEPYGSLEVFHTVRVTCSECGQVSHAPEGQCCDESNWQPLDAGWFWWACEPGCMPDGDATGPFATSRLALEDADEWNPEFDEDEFVCVDCDERFATVTLADAHGKGNGHVWTGIELFTR